MPDFMFPLTGPACGTASYVWGDLVNPASQKGYNPWKVLYGYKMYISTFQKIKGLLIKNERSCQPFILTNANFSLLFL